jgi:hypothetical protein
LVKKILKSCNPVKKNIKKIILYKKTLFLLLILSFAQVAYTQARLSTRLDTTRIYIGEALHVYVTLQVPKNTPIQPPILETSGEIVVLDNVCKRTTQGNNATFTQTWTLTALAEGKFVLPALPYTYTINGKTDSLFTDIAAFDAVPMPVDTTKIKLIAPVMDEPFWWRDAQYYIAALLLCAIGFFVYLHFRNKKRTTEIKNNAPPEPEIPAHEWAYNALANLAKADFLSKNEPKKHYIELSNIFRTYIEKRYQISILEKTSDETLPILQKTIENWTFFEHDTRTFLQTTDLIKFAKAQTTSAQDADFWAFVERFIAYTKNEQTQNL